MEPFGGPLSIGLIKVFNLLSNKLLRKKTDNSAPMFSFDPVIWLFLLKEVAGIGYKYVTGHPSGSCQMAMIFNHCQSGAKFEPVT